MSGLTIIMAKKKIPPTSTILNNIESVLRQMRELEALE